MALFRKFFYRKPPDGLLEISERVYVFDCCFSTDVLEEEEYKIYMGGIVAQLQEYFPDASFMVFNFREGENQSQIANILQEYDMTVMDYPRHYEGCPLLTMEMIHHFLRSSESWLSLGQQNLLLMHCERGGWPVLAFMLAALLIYRKQYTVEQKTLDMIYKQAPRELLQLLQPLNPLPSQLRYLQYVSRRNVGSEWPPLDRALTLDCVILRMLPNFDGEGGCRPVFRIYGQDPFIASDRTPKVLFSTPKKSKSVRLYRQADCELVKIDIHCHIQGDVVLECISIDEDLEREEMMFRVMFNTAFIRSNILMLNRDEIDILWDAKDRFPKDFRAEVLLSEMDAAASLITMDLASVEEKEGLPMEAFAKVHEIFSNVDWLDVKGDAALHVLQKIKSSNAFQEILEARSPHKEETDTVSQKSSQDIKDKVQSDDSNEIIMKTLVSPPKLSVPFRQSPASDKKNHDVHLHDLQVPLQRPSKSKIITQRLAGSTRPNSVSSNSPQGSPLPVSRYHSAPSALGITALLHDHAAFGSSESTCTMVSQADSSLSANAASGAKGSLLALCPPELITSSAGDGQIISSQPIVHHPPPPPPPPPSPPTSVTFMTSVHPPQHGRSSPVKGQGVRVPSPPPLPAPRVGTPSSSFSSGLSKSARIPPAPAPTSVSTSGMTASPLPPPPPPIVTSSTPSPPPPLPKKDAGVTVTPPPPPPPPPKKDAGTAVVPPPPPLPKKDAGSTILPPPPPLPSKNSGAIVAPPPPPPPSKNAGAAVAPPPPPPPRHAPPGTTSSAPPPPPLGPRQSSGSTQNSTLVPPAPPLKGPGAASPQSKSSGTPSSLGVKGRPLTRMSSPRSMHSTQSKRASLKPLHWVKVTRAMQGSLWAETQKADEASKAPEFDMSELESLFSAAVPISDNQASSDKSNRRASLGHKPDKVHLVDLRRANNCEIMLTKVKIPLPDLMSSLLALDDSILDIDQVDNLIKFCPTKEEMELLKGYSGDTENLGKCEQFFLELMKVPRVESKLRVFSFKIQFRSQVTELSSNLNIVNSAAEEVRNSVKLKRIMQTILSLGNALNQGTARGSAIGFRLDSLLKLTDTRARNNKMTLMHYLCKVLTEKLPELLDFPKDLVSLEAAAKIQLKSLAEEMQAISKGLEKVEQELTASENDGPVSQSFRKTLMEFLVVAEAEVRALTSLYSGVGRNADALALYFGEDPARCPFEQVVSTLLNFVKMFVRAHEENCKQLELEKKKAQKEAENEKMRITASNKSTENTLHSPVRKLNTK